MSVSPDDLEYTELERKAIAAKLLRVDMDASDEEITKAFRDRTPDVHPDTGGSVEMFKAVKSAEEILDSDTFLDPKDLETIEEEFRAAEQDPKFGFSIDEAIAEANLEDKKTQADVSEESRARTAADIMKDMARGFSAETEVDADEVNPDAITVVVKTKILFEAMQEFFKEGFNMTIAANNALSVASTDAGKFSEIESSGDDDLRIPRNGEYFSIFEEGFVQAITKEDFLEALESVEGNIQGGFRNDIDLDGLSRTITKLILSGIIDLTDLSDFQGKPDGDDPFTRTRRDDPFTRTREDDPFTRTRDDNDVF